ncbi:Na+/H+ antiporter [Desulfatibacillum aliphaticivorans]|uniref:Na(+)/H(+) antiporter NhaA n=2 Tax=Desulfatibacillum aliphaticivorans TaxID=218208 RepID=B8FBH3_DESAL|nr:Na+/H+ antiporter [Desulfatibacillum aliphaticivorans]
MGTDNNHARRNHQRPHFNLEVFQRFIHKAASGSMPLFTAAVLAVIWANVSPYWYREFWNTPLYFGIGGWNIEKTALNWINDGFMALFFFTVGMEIKREFLVGELASLKMALLPVTAALGGMLVPMLIYSLFNHGEPTFKGWGIPMATDIAFSLAVLSVFGKGIPVGLRIFLSALAIADDLGAVLVIALFYSSGISIMHLAAAVGLVACLYIANRLWVRNILVYIVLGIGIWLAVMGSGMHATIAGAITAMFVPARGRYDTDMFTEDAKKMLHRFECAETDCKESMMLDQEHLEAVLDIEMACRKVETPIQRMEYNLHSWVAYLILPVFALANTGLVIGEIDFTAAFTQPVTIGIILGLVAGKPAGIFLFSFLSEKILKTPLPKDVGWKHMAGVSMLGGIGFTMSLFISGLAFTRPEFASYAKVGIICGSLISAIAGFIVLKLVSKKPKAHGDG